jgi:hydroxymethylpyrimidine pyrophosphatase-like HAD family hydrolase
VRSAPLALERPIRVFACDIDGCLAAVDHAAFDLLPLHAIAELNRASAHDPTVPALTLVTGRPHAFADAVMQLLDVRLPASFENGAGLATRIPYRAWLAPAVDAGGAALAAVTAALARRDDVFVQLGKVASLSVFPNDPARPVEDLSADLAALLAREGLPLEVDPSTGCVNLLLPGVDKASGLRDLCAEAGVDPAEVAGIGDAIGDLAWLRACGVAFAPSNAVPEVRAAATVASALPDVAATLAAYETLVAANRALLG